MGAPTKPELQEITEASQALVTVAQSVAAKIEGGLSPDEIVQVWKETAVSVEKGVEGLSGSVLSAAFKSAPEETIEIVASCVAQAAGIVVGKPVSPVEKSDAVEIVEAIGSVAVGFVGSLPSKSIPFAVLGSLVANRAKIAAAVEGRTAIASQFQANPFGQSLAVVSSVLGYVRSFRGPAA